MRKRYVFIKVAVGTFTYVLQPYNAKAQKDKARYEKEMKTYTPPSDDESDDERPTKKRKVAKKKKDPNAPKNPMNAYFFYVKENRDAYKAKHSDLKMTEITKALGSQWKEMSESERAVFCFFEMYSNGSLALPEACRR